MEELRNDHNLGESIYFSRNPVPNTEVCRNLGRIVSESGCMLDDILVRHSMLHVSFYDNYVIHTLIRLRLYVLIFPS